MAHDAHVAEQETRQVPEEIEHSDQSDFNKIIKILWIGLLGVTIVVLIFLGVGELRDNEAEPAVQEGGSDHLVLTDDAIAAGTANGRQGVAVTQQPVTPALPQTSANPDCLRYEGCSILIGAEEVLVNPNGAYIMDMTFPPGACVFARQAQSQGGGVQRFCDGPTPFEATAIEYLRSAGQPFRATIQLRPATR